MNKEVIYLEPEDDITDILTKLQRAEQKLVALVPPKKASMLRSAVNMKLVARAAKESKKIAVLVTADPAIVKLAMAAQIPVAKTLQSRPVVPTPEMLRDDEAEEQVIDEDLADEANKTSSGKAKNAGEGTSSAAEANPKKSADVINIDEESLENGSKDAKKGKNKGDKSKKVPNLDKYRKWIIIGVCGVLALVVLGVWAFVFAPAVQITVAMHTTSENFSENVTFTTDKSLENVAEGKFYAEKISYEDKFEADFTATGQEDRGEKAKGTLKLSKTLSAAEVKTGMTSGGYEYNIPKGTVFSASNGLNYYSTESKTIKWDGEVGGSNACPSSNSACTLSDTIAVEAANSGPNYDVGVNATWSSGTGLNVSSSTGITGGTSKMVTIVTQADVNKAAEGRDANAATESKERLMSEVSKDEVAIESSYNVEVGDLKPSPAVGAEASDGKAHLTAVTTYSIYIIEKSKLEEYIKSKVELSNEQRIYSIGSPYFERFTKIEEEARLKTTVEIGPTVTEESILERARGRKIGEVQSLLRSINGVSSVDIKSSYFWVSKVPKDDSKVTIDLTVEEQ